MGTSSYDTIIQNSEQVAWTIEQVLRPEAKLDFTRPFLPDSLANVAGLQCLNDQEKLTLNHIRGNAYLYLFAFVEEYIIATAVRHAEAEVYGDHAALRALLRFAEEEVKHQEMFRRFGRVFESGFGHRCDVIPNPEQVAEVILSHKPIGVMLITLHLELMTQQHFVESFRRGTAEELDPLFRDMLRFHWLEEAQHAKIDAMEIQKLAQDSAPDFIEQSIDDYIKIVGALDGLLKDQARRDVGTLASVLGRSFTESERDEILAAQVEAYQRTFVSLGINNPGFVAALRELSMDGAARVAEVAARYPRA